MAKFIFSFSKKENGKHPPADKHELPIAFENIGRQPKGAMARRRGPRPGDDRRESRNTRP